MAGMNWLGKNPLSEGVGAEPWFAMGRGFATNAGTGWR
jgi:hypothetical protein